jgi:hypothetical protein
LLPDNRHCSLLLSDHLLRRFRSFRLNMSAPGPGLAPDPARWNESRGHELTITAIVSPILPTILTALRIYTRLVLIKKRFWEDASIVAALVRESPVRKGVCLNRR